MIKNPTAVLEHIGRDEYRLDESKVWSYFTKGQQVTMTLTGVILVPNKILIAVGKPVGGLSEVPCVAIAKNSWPYTAKDSMAFVERAVQQRGSAFRDLVGTPKSKQGSVKCHFAEQPFTSYYVGLEKEQIFDFEA